MNLPDAAPVTRLRRVNCWADHRDRSTDSHYPMSCSEEVGDDPLGLCPYHRLQIIPPKGGS